METRGSRRGEEMRDKKGVRREKRGRGGRWKEKEKEGAGCEWPSFKVRCIVHSGIAAGKSTVSNLLQSYGATIMDAVKAHGKC